MFCVSLHQAATQTRFPLFFLTHPGILFGVFKLKQNINGPQGATDHKD